jgi:hypothetical protein
MLPGIMTGSLATANVCIVKAHFVLSQWFGSMGLGSLGIVAQNELEVP